MLAGGGRRHRQSGAESTRPGLRPGGADEQIARLRPILRGGRAWLAGHLDSTGRPRSRGALDAGAAIVNDVSAGRCDERCSPLVARRGCPVVLMHMLGRPKTMQQDPQYADVVAEVRDFRRERLAAAKAAGVRRDRCIVDPGIGFGKRART